MAARYLLGNSTSENNKFCQHQQNGRHHQQHQEQLRHHESVCQRRYHGHHRHLDQPSANTHRQHSSSTIEDTKGNVTTPLCAYPTGPQVLLQEGGVPKAAAASVVAVPSLLPPSTQPSANSNQTQFSITIHEGDSTTFSSPQEEAAGQLPKVILSPPPSLSLSLSSRALPVDQWTAVHMYNNSGHYQQNTCLHVNGEEHKPMFYHCLLPSSPQSHNYPAVVTSTAYTEERGLPLQSIATTSQQYHGQLLQQCGGHEPLYGCGCEDCVTFFSSPGHGYLSPLTHFGNETMSSNPPSSPSGHIVSGATPAASYSYCSGSSFVPASLPQVMVRRF